MDTNEYKDNAEVAVKNEDQQQEVARQEISRSYIPAVDVIEGENESILYADMPGVDQSSIDITVEKNVLTIKGKVERPKFEGYDVLYSEYGIGDFERSFTLGEDVDRENISASMKDGVLMIKLPNAKPVTKKIEVSVAG